MNIFEYVYETLETVPSHYHDFVSHGFHSLNMNGSSFIDTESCAFEFVSILSCCCSMGLEISILLCACVVQSVRASPGRQRLRVRFSPNSRFWPMFLRTVRTCVRYKFPLLINSEELGVLLFTMFLSCWVRFISIVGYTLKNTRFRLICRRRRYSAFNRISTVGMFWERNLAISA